MRYFRARLRQAREDYLYRVYMTDSVYWYARGKSTSKRWADILQQADKPPDRRTGDEIAADLIARMGLKVK